LCCIDCTTQPGVISKLAEDSLDSITYVIDKDVEEYQTKDRLLWTLVVTSLHLDMELLTTTIWLQPSNQFLIH